MTTPYIPFTRLSATTISVSTTPTPLASRAVLDGQARGRCALEIVNTSNAPVYIGSTDVDKTHGLIIPAGQSRYLPVTSGAKSSLYISAETASTVTLAEYFA